MLEGRCALERLLDRTFIRSELPSLPAHVEVNLPHSAARNASVHALVLVHAPRRLPALVLARQLRLQVPHLARPPRVEVDTVAILTRVTRNFLALVAAVASELDARCEELVLEGDLRDVALQGLVRLVRLHVAHGVVEQREVAELLPVAWCAVDAEVLGPDLRQQLGARADAAELADARRRLVQQLHVLFELGVIDATLELAQLLLRAECGIVRRKERLSVDGRRPLPDDEVGAGSAELLLGGDQNTRGHGRPAGVEGAATTVELARWRLVRREWVGRHLRGLVAMVTLRANGPAVRRRVHHLVLRCMSVVSRGSVRVQHVFDQFERQSPLLDRCLVFFALLR